MPNFRDVAEFTAVEAIHETDAAVLCEIDGQKVWIPRSQIADESEVQEQGDYGTLIVSQWIAEQKDLV